MPWTQRKRIQLRHPKIKKIEETGKLVQVIDVKDKQKKQMKVKILVFEVKEYAFFLNHPHIQLLSSEPELSFLISIRMTRRL